MKAPVAFVLLSSLFGCVGDRKNRQRILGIWEAVAMGNGENMHPIDVPAGYRHFLRGSLPVEYGYATKRTFTKKYWMDSLSHSSTTGQDRFLITFDYRYQFHQDEMRWGVVNANAFFYASIHNRTD
ncbi:hypothetical protein [Salmonirosea aquatica]|uniref:Lipocalin-like domain-containing protein n=1 Tax=Salmonirosea aquatica TaxID=2654236 RepID=A0A7C9BK85_9BACT|nr:hypothetical protein [Cytophagaceae bacterium SJW1-29]